MRLGCHVENDGGHNKEADSLALTNHTGGTTNNARAPLLHKMVLQTELLPAVLSTGVTGVKPAASALVLSRYGSAGAARPTAPAAFAAAMAAAAPAESWGAKCDDLVQAESRPVEAEAAEQEEDGLEPGEKPEPEPEGPPPWPLAAAPM